MDLTFTITEEKRQAMLLAIAKLALERPGWDHMLGEIADTLQGRPMYDEYKKLNTKA